MELTDTICEVSPFLSTYDPVTSIPVAHCCMVWTCLATSMEWLLVADQMLWFGSILDHSLINPNQLSEYGLSVFDNPYTTREFGIETDKAFIHFNTTGTVVHFKTRVPTEWEEDNLPVLLLTSDEWDREALDMGPFNDPYSKSKEGTEMQKICSLSLEPTKGMSVETSIYDGT